MVSRQCGCGIATGVVTAKRCGKLILYNLTDVVNMVEFMETTVRLKQPHLAFPGEITAHAPIAARTFHAGGLGTWITETLSSWNLA